MFVCRAAELNESDVQTDAQTTDVDPTAIAAAQTQRGTQTGAQPVADKVADEIAAALHQAKILLEQRHYQHAIAHCRQALKLQPNAAAHKLLGNIWHHQGEAENAIAAYQRALKLQPGWAEVYANLGSLFAQRQEWQKAIKAYQQAIALKPEFAGAHRNLARIWQQRGKPKLALECQYKAAMLESAGVTAETFLNLGNQFLENRQFIQAANCYRRTLQLDASLTAAHENLAQTIAECSAADVTAKRSDIPILEKVSIGKDGWLFLHNDTNGVIAQITGQSLFSDAELQQWNTLLHKRHEQFRDRGIPYFFLIVPNKHCVYPEYLPDGIELSETRNVVQLLNFLKNKAPVQPIYPLEALLAAKRERRTYIQQDSHWNYFGAFVGYEHLMAEVSKQLPSVGILDRSAVKFEERLTDGGDLGRAIGKTVGMTTTARIPNATAECIFDNKIVNTGNIAIYENANQDLPKAIVFRDSFCGWMAPFLAESFSRLVLVWQPNIDQAIVDQEQPDVVISQQIERFLVTIPDDEQYPSHAERVQQKRPQS